MTVPAEAEQAGMAAELEELEKTMEQEHKGYPLCFFIYINEHRMI